MYQLCVYSSVGEDAVVEADALGGRESPTK